MSTAKDLGFIKGDYAITKEGFVAKLLEDLNTDNPFCEVWSLEHELISIRADELREISKPEAENLIAELSQDFGHCSPFNW